MRIKLRVPKNAVAGEYQGDLVVSVDGAEVFRIPMTLNVLHRGRGGAFEVVPLNGSPEPRPNVTPSPGGGKRHTVAGVGGYPFARGDRRDRDA